MTRPKLLISVVGILALTWVGLWIAQGWGTITLVFDKKPLFLCLEFLNVVRPVLHRCHRLSPQKDVEPCTRSNLRPNARDRKRQCSRRHIVSVRLCTPGNATADGQRLPACRG